MAPVDTHEFEGLHKLNVRQHMNNGIKSTKLPVHDITNSTVIHINCSFRITWLFTRQYTKGDRERFTEWQRIVHQSIECHYTTPAYIYIYIYIYNCTGSTHDIQALHHLQSASRLNVLFELLTVTLYNDTSHWNDWQTSTCHMMVQIWMTAVGTEPVGLTTAASVWEENTEKRNELVQSSKDG